MSFDGKPIWADRSRLLSITAPRLTATRIGDAKFEETAVYASTHEFTNDNFIENVIHLMQQHSQFGVRFGDSVRTNLKLTIRNFFTTRVPTLGCVTLSPFRKPAEKRHDQQFRFIVHSALPEVVVGGADMAIGRLKLDGIGFSTRNLFAVPSSVRSWQHQDWPIVSMVRTTNRRGPKPITIAEHLTFRASRECWEDALAGNIAALSDHTEALTGIRRAKTLSLWRLLPAEPRREPKAYVIAFNLHPDHGGFIDYRRMYYPLEFLTTWAESNRRLLHNSLTSTEYELF